MMVWIGASVTKISPVLLIAMLSGSWRNVRSNCTNHDTLCPKAYAGVMAVATITALARARWDAIFFVIIPLRPDLAIPDIEISSLTFTCAVSSRKVGSIAAPERVARGRMVKPMAPEGIDGTQSVA